MSVALARAPSLEDAMMVDSWRPSSPERQCRGPEWYPTTFPSMATTTAMEAPATPERESKRRCIASKYSPSAAGRAPIWQPQPPIPSAPVLAPASFLPDELLIYILTSTKWSPRHLASAARVCRRWLPAATQVLYSSLDLSTEYTEYTERASKLAQTMWNSPYLRALVRRLDVSIETRVGVDVDVQSILGWTALIPPEPGLHTLALWTNDAGSSASILARAPAFRAVRDLRLNGHGTPSLLTIPRSLERLDICGVRDVTLPPLPRLRSLTLAALRVTLLHKYEQLQTLELTFFDPTHACEIVDKLSESHYPNLRTLSLSFDPGTVVLPQHLSQIIKSLSERSSVTVLRVELHTATSLLSLSGANIEELHVRVSPFGRFRGYDLRALNPVILSGGGKLKVVQLEGVAPSEEIKAYMCNLGVVRVEFVEASNGRSTTYEP